MLGNVRSLAAKRLKVGLRTLRPSERLTEIKRLQVLIEIRRRQLLTWAK